MPVFDFDQTLCRNPFIMPLLVYVSYIGKLDLSFLTVDDQLALSRETEMKIRNF